MNGVAISTMVIEVGIIGTTLAKEAYYRKLRYETFPNVEVEVCKKKHIEAYITEGRTVFGRMVVPKKQYHAEQYNVYFMYQGKEYCLDNKELYEQVELCCKIHVNVHKGYNKSGKEKKINFTKD